MSKNKRVTDTGFKELNDDLKELFEICEGDKLNAIKDAIANKELSSDEFAKVVPKSVIRLSSFLVGPQFHLFVESVRKDSIPLIREAKSLIEKHFLSLFEHEAARSLLKEEMKEGPSHEESLHDKGISGVTHYRIWAGSPPELTPAVCIGFKNKKGKILWESKLDWDDLSFLLDALAKILFDLLDEGKSLVECKQIDLSDAQKVGERIENTLEHFENIKKLAPTYGIKIGKESKENDSS